MFLNLIGTEHELTMAYSKEENGMVERANKETLRHLRNIIFDRDVIRQWSIYLPLVKRIFNSSIHSVTGVAPAHVIFGHAVNLDRNIFKQPTASTVDTESMSQWMGDLIQGQQTIMELVKKNLDRQREKHVEKQINPDFTEFPIDSYVLVEHVGGTLRRGPKSKLFPFLKGPMKVISVNGDKYNLRNLITRKEKDYHVSRLREYLYDPETISPLKVACKDDNSVHPVEYIERMRGRPNDKKEKLQFLVHWIDDKTPTWEPWKNVRSTFALYYFLSNQEDQRFHRMIPKNIRYEDSDDEIDSENEG
jgi:hypothetical protein